jgi:hypothetical protein
MEVDAVEQPPLAAPASVRPVAASSTESPPPSTAPVQEPLNPVKFFVFFFERIFTRCFYLFILFIGNFV